MKRLSVLFLILMLCLSITVALSSCTGSADNTPDDGETPGGDITPDDGETPGGDITPDDGETPGGDITPDDGETPGGDITPDDGETPGGDITPDDGETPGSDDDSDDKTEAIDPQRNLILIENGKSKFKIVYNNATISDGLKSAVSGFIGKMRNNDILVSTSYDINTIQMQDCEILLGTVSNRDGYVLDPAPLGMSGYIIRVIDDKVIIVGTTDEATLAAFERFTNECLCINDEETDLKNLYVSRELSIENKEQYTISSIQIGGVDLGEYAILCNTDNAYEYECATLIQRTVYIRAGYIVPITDTREADGRYIEIVSTNIDKSVDPYTITVVEGNMMISCQYAALFNTGAEEFLDRHVAYETEGDILFPAGFEFTPSISHYVHYRDFGAVGDGFTDDFLALKAAHDEANRTGQTVVAGEGDVYHLGVHEESITIKTDVIWTGAYFIIDDSAIAPSSKASRTDVFVVWYDQPSYSVSGIGPLTTSSDSVGVTFDTPVLLNITNSNIKQYIRYGENADAGASQSEIIIVDENGRIDESTPLLWNYDVVTSAVAYPINDRPISIVGGTFTTIANRAPRQYTYYARGISIRRSNVTLEGITHLITGEGETGAPYNGFLAVSCANNVTFRSIVYSGHKTYKLEGNDNNSMGTYDISANSANNVKWIGCTQANSITDTTLWGVMGSNYCKNLTYDGCTLSRFDAHKGMYNATIKGSVIGHVGINAIGAGTLLIEDTVIHKNNVVNLRGDYGSTWDGDVIIRNVELKNTGSTVTLFSASWYNHYFGYTCHLPRNVIVDNLKVASGTRIYIFPSFSGRNVALDTVNGTANLNPVVVTECVTVLNNKNGYTYYVSSNTTDMFKDTLLKYE